MEGKIVMKLKKIEGWEARLNELHTRYFDEPLIRGQNCCFLYISDCIEALCGHSPLAKWRGEFKSLKKGLRLLKENYGGEGFENIFEGLTPVKSFKHAQRGDMGIWHVPEGEYLGCVAMNGRDFYIRVEKQDGLKSVPLNKDMKLWRAE